VTVRIGELFVRDGLATEADVSEALAYGRQQRMRLASALVTLGRVSADDASRALAEQHGVPAALTKHLAGRDLALAALLPTDVAWALGALPIATARGNDALVVCVRDPVPSAITTIERATGRPVVLAVAVEVMLMALIDESYSVPESVDVDLDTGPVDADGLDLGSLQLVDLDDRAVSKDHSQSDLRVPSRTSGIMPAVAPPPDPEARTLALDPALLAITAATSRDQVIDALLGYLRHRFAAGVVFVCRDRLALGQAGFGSDVVAEAVASLVVPLGQPSVLRLAHDQAARFAGAPPPATASPIQDRFFKLFGAPPAEVAVVPVTIKKRVVNLLYGHDPRRATIEEAANELGTLAAAAEAAFVKIILEAKGS